MYDQQKLQGLPIITLRVCPFESLFPCHFSTIFFNNTTYAFLGSVIIRKTLQILVTTRKRSLGQGNIFTPVILSTGGGGVGRYTPGTRYTPLRAVHAGRYGQQAGGTHPTGMHSCFHFFLLFIREFVWNSTDLRMHHTHQTCTYNWCLILQQFMVTS